MRPQRTSVTEPSTQLGLAFDAASVGMCLTDAEGRILSVNEAATRMFSLDAADLIGRHFYILLRSPSRTVARDAYFRLLESGCLSEPDWLVRRRDGKPMWVRVSPTVLDCDGDKCVLSVLTDVSEVFQARDALQESEDRFRVALKSGALVAFQQDLELRYTWIYPHRGDFSSVVIGKTDAELTTPEDAAALTEIKRRVIETGQGVRQQMRSTLAAGARYFDLLVEPLRDSDGKVIGVGGAAVDITDRLRAEDAAKASDARFRRLMEAGIVGITYWHMDGRILHANDAFLSMLGYTRQELEAGKLNWKDLTPTEWLKINEQGRRELFKNRYEKPYEKEYLRKDGSRVPVIIGGALFDDSDEEGVSFIVDLTERKQMEEALRRSETQYRMMFEQSPLAIQIFNSEGDCVMANRAWEELWDTKREQLEGYNILRDPQLKERGAVDVFRRAFQGHAVSVPATRYDPAEIGKVGRIRWVQAQMYPILDESGKVSETVLILQDVTERKEAEELVFRMNETLEARVHERTQELEFAYKEMEAFSYSVSHDLRTPLRAVIASSKMLIEDYGKLLPEEGQDHLLRQAAAARKLGALIDDLLQFSRLGRTEIHVACINLSALAAEVAANAQARYEVEADVRIEPGMWCEGDAPLLRVALENLFDNAFKYACVDRALQIEFGRDAQCYFIRDNGVGFDEKYIEKLFQPFERLHRDQDYPGTGIGLANVRRVIERHGGSIHAIGRPGEGATFFFTLP